MENILRKKTICPLDCPDTCGMIATVESGRIINLKGDREHPYTNGVICRKMRSYPDRFYSKDRILYPQRRIGKKGEGKFERITWDEALTTIADKLHQIRSRHGGEAILPYSYAGNMGVVSRTAGYPLFHKLGASQLDQTICSAAAGAGWKYHCGELGGSPPENCSEAKLIVAWGINVKVSNMHFWQYITKARKQGARLVVIDPYRNQTAQSADSYIAVKPGGDSSLALALMKYILADNLVSLASLASLAQELDQLRSYLESISWNQLTADCGVEKTVIESLARELASNPQTFIRVGIGLSRNSRGGMSVRAITSLAALLDLFKGGPGRGVLLSSGAFKGDQAILTHPELGGQESRLVNMIHLGHALNSLKPQVKALIVYNANPATVNPDGSQVRKGLLREDLFTVVHEQVMTPTARYSDILLPATTFLENEDIYTGYGHFYLGVSQPVVSSLGESKSNFDFFQSLARRMGFDDPAFQESCEERLKKYLATLIGIPKGYDIDQLFKGDYLLSSRCRHERSDDEWQKQFCFVNDGNKNSLVAPFVSLAPEGEYGDPDLLTRFSLRLITPPHHGLLNSTFGERYPGRSGELLIHPEDGLAFGVDDGDMVLVENLRGASRRIARLSENTMPGVVVAEGLFWAVPENPGVSEPGSINDVTSQKLTDLGGGATFHESLVTISKYE